MDFCGTRTCDLQLGYIVNCYISVLGLYDIPLLLAGVSCLVPLSFFTVLSSHTRPRAVEPSLTLFYLDITHVKGKKHFIPEPGSLGTRIRKCCMSVYVSLTVT